jgi:hypothetical protein
MAVRLSAIHAGRLYPQVDFLAVISVRGSVNPKAMVRLEGLGKLKKSMPLFLLFRYSKILEIELTITIKIFG